MRVVVIRNDLSKALFVGDLEPKSASNPSLDTQGQNKYLSRPNTATIQSYLTAQGLSASVSALIAATVPVGGPVDVSSATITGVAGLGSATVTQVAAIQDLLSYRIVETDVAKKSFLFGHLAGYKASTFNPDPRRSPAMPSSAAIAVVADDGVTAFSVETPVITTADLDTPTTGALRITGTGFTPYSTYEVAVSVQGPAYKKLVTQAAILAAGGSVSGTVINVPASLLPGALVSQHVARVLVNDMVSPPVALT